MAWYLVKCRDFTCISYNNSEVGYETGENAYKILETASLMRRKLKNGIKMNCMHIVLPNLVVLTEDMSN